MASNFTIRITRKRKILHLKLFGDFDASSACELIDVIRQNAKDVKQIVMNTDNLNEVHSPAREVFYILSAATIPAI